MARISASSAEKIIPIKQFKGLNENLGGDTKLQPGEASVCMNWQVTRDGNLRRRPGQTLVTTLSAGKAVRCLWHGWIYGDEYLLAACDSKIYVVYDGSVGEWTGTPLSGQAINTNGPVTIFGFDEKAYILDGTNYCVCDGLSVSLVNSANAYVPLIANGISPVGTIDAGGTLLEQINKLSNKRRVWLSPDGTGASFQLPETVISSVLSVTRTDTGAAVPYTVNLITGVITMNTVPAVSTNSIEVVYTKGDSFAGEVGAMRYAEMYSGTADNRIFLYGDGTNELFYSDMDYNGNPRADYFPDMNEVAVGESNIPVTGLIRHQSRLICYKLDSTWSISASTISLEDGSLIPSFYVLAINRIIGNQSPGQVQLVLNNPRTLFNHELYEWRSNQSYTGNLTNDERQAKRISDKIYATLRTFNISDTICYDDNANQEYYIVNNGVAVVHNYAVDAWYTYNNVFATCFASHGGELYFGMANGEVRKFSDLAKNDYDTTHGTVVINAEWESGAMPFGMEYARKYSSTMWVSVKPETNSYVEIGVITDRKTEFDSRVVARGTSGFSMMDFRSFSFSDNTQPQIKKLKLKAKKFVYYRLIFRADQPNTTATILGADIRMRQTGYAK